jgi:hypothetical protein
LPDADASAPFAAVSYSQTPRDYEYFGKIASAESLVEASTE